MTSRLHPTELSADCGFTFILGQENPLPDIAFSTALEDLGLRIENQDGVTQFIPAIGPVASSEGNAGPPGPVGPKGDTVAQGPQGPVAGLVVRYKDGKFEARVDNTDLGGRPLHILYQFIKP
ncbi:MAG: hypothetical protein ACOH5I_23205 [Oligoflexus sp.]